MIWYSAQAKDVIKELRSDSTNGLSAAEAQKRLELYGKNLIKEKKQRGLAAKFFAQFADFMVIILLIAAAISFVTAIRGGEGDFVDPIVILVIVILNAVMGVVQESRAQKALDALKKLSAPEAFVIRSGKKIKVPAEKLVPGDIMLLETGCLVCADARLIDCVSLKTNESALTGESLPVSKDADLLLPESCAPADRKNTVLSGTQVMTGHGTAIVTHTGMDTQIGKIAGLLNSEKSPLTPLQQRLSHIGKVLGIGSLLICALIFVIGVINKNDLMDSFMLSVSLAVAAIPEGLPAIVTIVLSVGVQRMAKRNAVIKNLPAVETLGAATVICSDKTGTLTQNVMTVTRVMLSGGEAQIDGDAARETLSLAALCCNSTLGGTRAKRTVSGEPTENAILLAAESSGADIAALQRENPRSFELPFDSARKLMTVTVKTKNGVRSITKGAPDILLSRCNRVKAGGAVLPMSDGKRDELLRFNGKLAQDALRVIAVAYKDSAVNDTRGESALIFCGLIGMSDPPRKEAAAAVKTCKEAGIIPVMITGDHISTANAVAKQLGIKEEDSLSLVGNDLDSMSDEQLRESVKRCRVFARVTPEHKVRIVKAFRANGEIVAMTGDGVNDAPALKAADIGCAMGKSGTDVAKGAADMILTDDNFATIVGAVGQGRGIYDNIKKAIHFLLSCNIGEILVIFAATLMGMESPLLPIQLLWVNLVTDSLPAMSLGLEKADENIMKRPPADPNKSFFSGGTGFDIALEGMAVGALTLLAFVLGKHLFGHSLDTARTMAFATLSLSEIVHAFNMRSERSLFSIGFFSNKNLVRSAVICTAMQLAVINLPSLAALFSTVPLSPICWLTVAALSLTPLAVIETAKRMRSKRI